MALVKCPECGHDISTKADACPHCGYPLKDKEINVLQHSDYISSSNVSDLVPPKNDSWTQFYFKRKKKLLLIWGIVSIVAAILAGSFIALMFGSDIYSPFFISMALLCVGLIGLIITAFFKVVVRKIDGYTVLVYSGFGASLVVEGEVQMRTITNRHLYGNLPNNKQVWVNIDRDGSIKK